MPPPPPPPQHWTRGEGGIVPTISAMVVTLQPRQLSFVACTSGHCCAHQSVTGGQAGSYDGVHPKHQQQPRGEKLRSKGGVGRYVTESWSYPRERRVLQSQVEVILDEISLDGVHWVWGFTAQRRRFTEMGQEYPPRSLQFAPVLSWCIQMAAENAKGMNNLLIQCQPYQ